MTNGDKIRSMTDEELAFEIMCPIGETEECKDKNCASCCLEWLKMEVSE